MINSDLQKDYFSYRLLSCAQTALPKALKTSVWLLKIILPVSFFVQLLQFSGAITYLSVWMTPVFKFIGLSGETSIVFITSIFLPLYAPIAVMSSLSMSLRSATILAVMCLVSHNLIVETAIQKKTGSSYLRIFTTRIFFSFVIAYVLNWILPVNMMGNWTESVAISAPESFVELVKNWFFDSFWLIFKLIIIVSLLMMLQRILDEFNIIQMLIKPFGCIMKLFGLSENCSFLWLVGNTLGLTYGGAVMIEKINDGEISKEECDYLNYHLALSHSQLEDTLLFVSLGIPAFWIIFTRLFFAIIVVWIYRFKSNFF